MVEFEPGVADALMFLPFSTAPGGVTPDLAGGRGGLLRGGAGLAAAGHDGPGLSLAGDGFVEVAHDAGFDLADGALSFWFRPDVIAAQGLVGKDSREIAGGEMSVLLRNDGKVSFRLESDSVTYKAISSRALEANEWAHVEVSWGRDGMQLRLDGVLEGSASYTGGLSGNDEPWVIGADARSSSAGGTGGLYNFFRGAIDEVTLSGPRSDAPDPDPEPTPPGVADALMFLPFSTAPGGVTPDLAGGRGGLLRGGAGLAAAGHDGPGLSLAGDGFVEVAHDAGFDLADGALSFWFRPDVIAAQGLVGKDSREIAGGEMSVLLRNDGKVSFRLESDSVTYKAISSRALEANEWAHVEVSWGRDGMQLRLDGVLEGSASYTGGLSGNDEPWVIGADARSSSAGGTGGLYNFFRGAIDEVTLSGPRSDAPDPDPEPTPADSLSFAGQTDRAKDVDLQRGFWTDAVRVMPLGDSITRGERGPTDATLDVGYRGFLWSHITAAGGFVDFVGGEASGPATLPDRDHQGVGGIKAKVVKTLAEDHARAHHPDVVLLMLGTNDIKFSSAATRTVPEDLLSIMQSIEKVEPDVTILLAELPPIDPSAPGYKYLAGAAAARETINAGLPDLIARAQALGIDARLAPASGLTTNDLFDGIHPTPGGYAKLADAWYAALESGLASGAFGGARHGTAGVQNVQGSELGDRLRGDDGDNWIFGRQGADVIEGGDGDDRLSGGGGGDVFLWRTPGQGADVITDFQAEDFIQVFAAGFGGGIEAGDAALLRSGANPSAQGGAGQFLYDRDDGGLFWDADGAGAHDALLFVTLTGAPALDAGQLLIA